MLKHAYLAVLTKGDIVSQAEREVFAFHVRQVNRSAERLVSLHDDYWTQFGLTETSLVDQCLEFIEQMRAFQLVGKCVYSGTYCQ